MPDTNLLDIHRRIMASATDADICWWYLGTTFILIDGYPEIAALQAETIMIYRPETLSANQYRIHWREIGYFRDPISGEVATNWLNPITGETVAAPNSFEEGPSAYTVTATEDGLAVDLEQAHATVRGIDVTLREISPGRFNLIQNERKVRGFPLPDGSMPSADSKAVSETNTELSIFADRAAIEAPEPDLTCTGVYTFALSSLPPWAGFGERKGRAVVKGVMRKASMHDPVNEIALIRLRAAFPRYFSGTKLTPPW